MFSFKNVPVITLHYLYQQHCWHRAWAGKKNNTETSRTPCCLPSEGDTDLPQLLRPKPCLGPPRAVPAFGVTPIKRVGDPEDSACWQRTHHGRIGMAQIYGITQERLGWVWGMEPQQPQDLGQLLLPEMPPSASPLLRLVLGKS